VWLNQEVDDLLEVEGCGMGWVLAWLPFCGPLSDFH
jgi:hypothetical protein